MKNSVAIWYKDTATGEISSESIDLHAIRYFFEDEAYGLIEVLEIDQTFDGWETMIVLYKDGVLL